MRIAVPYENGNIFQHFGRSETFKFYDVDGGAVTAAAVVSTNGSGHGALAGFLQDAGVEITELTDAEFQAFKDATSSVYDTYVPQIDPAVYELVCNKIDALRG